MTIDSNWLLGFGFPGGYEWIILLVLGLLIFGRLLPEVGRSLGKGIVEFKRGIKGIEDEIEDESSRQPALQPPEPVQPPADTTPRQAVEPAPASTPAPAAEQVEASDPDRVSG